MRESENNPIGKGKAKQKKTRLNELCMCSNITRSTSICFIAVHNAGKGK